MKIFILSNDDMTSNLIFSYLFNDKNIEILGVVFSGTLVPKKKNIFLGAIELLRKIDFHYWVYLVFVNFCYKMGEFIFFAISSFFTSKDSYYVRSLCKKNKIPVYKLKNINCPEFCSIIRRFNPDLLIIRINQILKEEILSIPRYGTWCVHSSILPSYQGIAAEFHALRKGEAVLGTTIFEVTKKLDQGLPLFQVEFISDIKKSLFFHMVYNNQLAGELLKKVINSKKENNVVSKLTERNIQKSYYSWPSKDQVKEFKKRGGSLISYKEIFKILYYCFIPYKVLFHSVLK